MALAAMLGGSLGVVGGLTVRQRRTRCPVDGWGALTSWLHILHDLNTLSLYPD